MIGFAGLFLLLMLTSCAPTTKSSSAAQEEFTAPKTKEALSSKSAHHIKTSSAINDILAHIDSRTLVVFDIDTTLAWVPGHTWPYPEVAKLALAEGAATKIMWKKLQKICSNQSMEQGCKFIGLTARAEPLDDTSAVHTQLNKLGLSASYAWLHSLDVGEHVKEGIIYANHRNKGAILNNFINAVINSYNFNKIIYIDDRFGNIKKIHQAIKTNHYIKSSIGFWYQGAQHPTEDISEHWRQPTVKAGLVH